MSNFEWAAAAYFASVGKLSTYGSDNKRFRPRAQKPDLKAELAAYEKRDQMYLRLAALKKVQPLRGSPWDKIIEYGRTVLASEAGNCFEYAAAACAFLDGQKTPLVFDIVRMPTLDHAFVVVGEAFPENDGKYPADFSAWSPDAAICDGWAQIFCTPHQYPERWNLRMDEWNASDVEVPSLIQEKAWGSPVAYKNIVDAEIKESYRWSGRKKWCFITTATCRSMGLADDCRELTALRWFRDNVMLATERGRSDVANYYALAPAIVAALDAQPRSGELYADLYRRFILPAVSAIERGDHALAYRLYAALVGEVSSTWAGAGASGHRSVRTAT